MKTVSKILVLVFGVLFFASCTDLNTFPEGGTKTEAQKQAAIESNADLLSADVSAIYATMIELWAGLGSANEFHSDFGYAALAIIMDANGQDVTCPNIGYNWFSSSYDFSGRVYTSSECLMTWRVYYKIPHQTNCYIENHHYIVALCGGRFAMSSGLCRHNLYMAQQFLNGCRMLDHAVWQVFPFL